MLISQLLLTTSVFCHHQHWLYYLIIYLAYFIYLFCSELENSQISVHLTSRNSKAKSTNRIADL